MKYIVQPWETFESIETIAARFGIPVNDLRMSNPILNTIAIYPCMLLKIPGYPSISLPRSGYVEYVIQPGDSIYKIANKFRLDYRKVISQNPQIVNPDLIWPGQILYLIYA